MRVRFAPSPTGYLHVGGLRTALYDYLIAKKNKGEFLLRIEDTDQTRFVEGAVENIIRTLQLTGINYDEGPFKEKEVGPYVQSQRLEIYRQYAEELVKNKHAYYCFCSKERLDNLRQTQQAAKQTPRYDKHCLQLSEEEVRTKIAAGEPYVIRLNVPLTGQVNFTDLVRSEIVVNLSEIDDQVLLKSDGFPTYHLAVVVDDHLMKITHVIRGEEWLISTPKHILLYRALNWETPVYAHLPLLLNPDKSKLSKRQADVAVEDYLKKGYLPEAIVNFVALLGWNAGNDQEFFTLEELVENFSLERVNKAGAVFDLAKLDWMNAHYLRTINIERLATLANPFFVEQGYKLDDKEKFLRLLEVSRNRVTTLAELPNYATMFYAIPKIEDEKQLSAEQAQKVLSGFAELVTEKEGKITDEELNSLMKKLEVKGKNFYFPLMLALLGQTKGPELTNIVYVLGKEETLKRINKFGSE